MPSLNESRTLLNKNANGKKYDDDEVKQILNILENLATIDFEKFKTRTEK